MQNTLSASSIVTAVPGQISAEMNGEAVILDLKSGTYFGLNDVGSFVWEQVQSPAKISDIHRIMLNEFDVDPETCFIDLLELLDAFRRQQLITVENGHLP